MSHVLEIRDLRVEAPNGAVLLHGVSLDLNPGEVLGLIGESGAGKSTIGLASMGYGRGGCRITGGEIRLVGTEMREASRPTREAPIPDATPFAGVASPMSRKVPQPPSTRRCGSTPRSSRCRCCTG